MKLYFAYGANMHPESMAGRCPGATAIGAFVLKDWRLKFYSHATIEPNPGDQVSGVMWKLTPECVRSLDSFEGFPYYYTKRTWRQNGRKFFFYEMAAHRSGLPSISYVDNIAEAYRQWDLDPDHLHVALDEIA
jgi:gamma-glutamylcyclotransferase (GGCT)/AIG2-like uncharacterized protein YtfP